MRKKESNEDAIIRMMDALGNAARSLYKHAGRYNKYIDEAAIKGHDKRAKQLIKTKLRVKNLAEQFEMLKGNIELGAYTSKAISALSTLPASLNGCKGLLSESPDFAKLAKGIKEIFKDISDSEEALTGFNNTVDSLIVPEDRAKTSLDVDDVDESSEDYKNEYREMIERLRQTAKDEIPIVKPDEFEEATSTELTGNIDYDGLMKKENERK